MSNRIFLRVLVYDDDPGVRKLLQRGLAGYGYDILVTETADAAYEAAARKLPNIILLGISSETSAQGLALCRRIREIGDIPVIIVAEVDDKATRLTALNAGADDCVTKPFDIDELEARMRAVVRRSTFKHPNALVGEINVYDLTINLLKRRVTLMNHEIHLTPREYGLLTFLATNPGRVIPFEILVEKALGQVSSANPEQYVRVYVNNLRRKLGDSRSVTTAPRFIFNEHGIGYRFADE